MAEDDWEGWQALTDLIGDKVFLPSFSASFQSSLVAGSSATKICSPNL